MCIRDRHRKVATHEETIGALQAEIQTIRADHSRQVLEMQQRHLDVNKRQGGEIARNARMELEAKTGKAVISPLNAKTGIALNSSPEEEDTKE